MRVSTGIFILLLAFVFGCAIVCAAFWLAGFGFNERGVIALAAFLVSILVGSVCVIVVDEYLPKRTNP